MAVRMLGFGFACLEHIVPIPSLETIQFLKLRLDSVLCLNTVESGPFRVTFSVIMADQSLWIDVTCLRWACRRASRLEGTCAEEEELFTLFVIKSLRDVVVRPVCVVPHSCSEHEPRPHERSTSERTWASNALLTEPCTGSSPSGETAERLFATVRTVFQPIVRVTPKVGAPRGQI